MRARSIVILTIVIVLIAALSYFGEPFLDLLVLGPIRSALRSNEDLPAVSIESGKFVYCRMRCCDFRFPMPNGVRITAIDPVSGGFDTIKGAIYVVTTNGGPMDWQAYARLLQKHHFDVQRGDTSEADPPWVGPPAVRHHPEGYLIPFAAGTDDGGWVAVDTIGNSNKIGFSYFGDY